MRPFNSASFWCSLRDVGFLQADLTECDFKESDLLNAAFNQIQLKKCDFRGALNDLINPVENRVKGARFSLD
ncbi:MAG: pentapeptide repeat-containing protein [Methylotenera sp.]|nr:pentapeptide repeat-containing protein [Oligoflexia bacterium]